MALSKPVAIVIGVLTLVIGWLGYDALCKSRIGQKENVMAAVLVVALTIIAWGLCQLFSGRGAYMHFGAMLGTIMVANVYFVIMPGQRAMVAANSDGQQPDPVHGIRAKQRSVHNTYFTLPVLFVMISNHYAMTWGHEYNWLILIAMSIAGALIRVHFVQAHFGRPSFIPASLAAVLMIGIVTAIAPRPSPAPDSSVAAVTLQEVHTIVEARCTTCHAAEPTHAGFSAPPKGIILETPEQTLAHASTIHQQSVVTKAMPIGNLTGITEEERATLDRWFLAMDAPATDSK